MMGVTEWSNVFTSKRSYYAMLHHIVTSNMHVFSIRTRGSVLASWGIMGDVARDFLGYYVESRRFRTRVLSPSLVATVFPAILVPWRLIHWAAATAIAGAGGQS